MSEFKRPSVETERFDNPNIVRYVIGPLDRGFGYTLGNTMRRVLLSSLEGAAAMSIKIDGVQHEFSSIEGIREDVTDIVLNVKGIVFRDAGIADGPAVVTLDVVGPKTVTAGDLRVPSEFEVVNPEHHIATLNAGAKLTMSMRVRTGRGYVPADRNKSAEDVIGLIPIDSLFSPVSRCTYTVENTRVGQRTDYEKLTLEVETNGSILPDDAIARAGHIVNEHVSLFVDMAINPEGGELGKGAWDSGDEPDPGRLDIPIEDLELGVRAYNCLKRQGVNTVAQLVQLSEDDLLRIRNFGAKSTEEVKERLTKMDLSLKGGSTSSTVGE